MFIVLRSDAKDLLHLRAAIGDLRQHRDLLLLPVIPKAMSLAAPTLSQLMFLGGKIKQRK
jgi:hypothetical protein